jgi:hypothetical protein
LRELSKIRGFLDDLSRIPDSLLPSGLTWMDLLILMGYIKDGKVTVRGTNLLQSEYPARLWNPWPHGFQVISKGEVGHVVAITSNGKLGPWEDGNAPWLIKLDEPTDRGFIVADVTELCDYVPPTTKERPTWEETKTKAQRAKKGRKK